MIKGEAKDPSGLPANTSHTSTIPTTGSAVSIPRPVRSKVLLVIVSIVADLLMTGVTRTPRWLLLLRKSQRPGFYSAPIAPVSCSGCAFAVRVCIGQTKAWLQLIAGRFSGRFVLLQGLPLVTRG